MNHIQEMADMEQRIEDAWNRTDKGWQCPECHGVRVVRRQTRFDASPTGFQCNECGCQWTPRVAFKSAGAVRKRST
jgi:hypothetical protein